MFLAAVFCLATSAENYKVALGDVAAKLEEANPGDTIFVKDGVYENISLRWSADAGKDSPVVVTAENRGKVVITGESQLKIYGKGLTVSSLVFRDGHLSRGTVVEFRNGDNLAHECRMTDCVIDSYNPKRRDISYSYVHLYGKDNRVDGCSFLGRKNLGVTLIVMLNYEECIENGHLIENNYFGPRPVYGSNGAETIRVGTSQQCHRNSRTVIRNNVFDKCNGEVEVVSIKSGENVIENNVFYECQGVLALRHGDRNVAEGNLFIGNGVRNTGGIRIVGEDQIVRSNRFYGLTGDRFFSALALMNAVPNSLPNRYMQVKNVKVEDNVFVDCASIEFGTGNDFERTLAPVGIDFVRNVVVNESLDCPYEAVAEVDGVRFKGNKTALSASAVLPKGFARTVKTACDIPSYEAVIAGKGASWYQRPEVENPTSSEIIYAGPGENLAAVVSSAPYGAIIELTGDEYALESGMNVSTKLMIRAAEGKKPVIRYCGRSRENMLTIHDGADLHVKGLTFYGGLTPGRSMAAGGISTAADMIEPYFLTVEDCVFSHYGESGFIPIKGLKGTFGEKVVIRGCTFEALSGDAISYASEWEDKGRYNGDDLIIEGCSFSRILGIPVNVYRGGNDESTAGPYVYLRNCRFDDCCNKVRGAAVRIIGAQVLEIAGCEFVNSGKAGVAVRLDEAPWEDITLKNLKFENSGGVRSNGDFGY